MPPTPLETINKIIASPHNKKTHAHLVPIYESQLLSSTPGKTQTQLLLVLGLFKQTPSQQTTEFLFSLLSTASSTQAARTLSMLPGLRLTERQQGTVYDMVESDLQIYGCRIIQNTAETHRWAGFGARLSNKHKENVEIIKAYTALARSTGLSVPGLV